MRSYKSDTKTRLAKRQQKRLEKLGFRLISKRGGYAILAYNDVVDAWTEADGLTPVPYSLSLEDVIALTHEYMAEAEIEEVQGETRLSVVA